jgi:ABC-type transport system involved in multi-copper enzyme maturation permease subunit
MMWTTKHSPQSPWVHMVWKEARLLRTPLLVIGLGTLSLQLLALSIGMLSNDPLAEKFWLASTLLFASLAAILMAFGSGGMLVAHEREMGTWQWSTSLPVPWWQVLLSKAIIAIAASASTAAVLTVIPVALWFNGKLPLGDWGYLWVYVGVTLLTLQIIAFGFVASLLFRESLTALTATAGLILLAQPYVLMVISQLLTYELRQLQSPIAFARSLVPALLMGAVTIAGIILLLLIFRYRWGRGLHAELRIGWKSEPLVTAQRRTIHLPDRPAKPWQIWLHGSVLNSWGVRLSITAGSLLFVAVLMSESGLDTVSRALPAIFCLAAGLLGLTTFSSDQTSKRYQFLADRGVRPWRLTLSRLTGSLVWIIGTAAICTLMLYWSRMSQLRLWDPGRSLFFVLSQTTQNPVTLITLNYAITLFLLGAFCSLCFRKVITSTLATFLTCFAMIFVAINALRLGILWLDVPDPLGIPAIFVELSRYMPIMSLLLIFGMFRSARRWIIREDPKLALHYAWFCPLAAVIPITIAVVSQLSEIYYNSVY